METLPLAQYLFHFPAARFNGEEQRSASGIVPPPVFIILPGIGNDLRRERKRIDVNGERETRVYMPPLRDPISNSKDFIEKLYRSRSSLPFI